jgi:PmbA protein
MDHIFQGVNGDAIYREASFLRGRLGQPVAHASVTVIDDGMRRGGFGSRPFDAEAVPTRRTVVIDHGVLSSYLLNTYTARKLQLLSTGNASRALAGNPGVGAGNLYLEPGTQSPNEIIRSIQRGLYVTEFIGSGINMVTGDYSRGAVGLWIENGELTYPVEEITVAGNLKEMLQNITMVGNDLEFRSSVAAPTVVVEGLTIGGT